MKPLLFDNRFIAELPADPVSGPGVREVRDALYSRVAPTRAPHSSNRLSRR